MSVIRITKEFHFEMAHALWNYDGSCSSIHGHSYKLFVTIKGSVIDDIQNPKNGMVADFGIIKKLVNKEITGEFDHSLVISKAADMSCIGASRQMFDRVHVVDFQPTCENLLVHFAARITKILPPGLNLFSLKLNETQTSYAEWFAEDNE